MSQSKNYSKSIFLLLIILAATLFLSGCTWFGGEDEGDTETESTVDEVTVIEDEDSEEETEEEVDDLVDEEEEDVSDDEEENVDEEEEEEEEEEVAETGESVGSATAANGAVINAYSYEVAGGKLNFSWKVDSNDDSYPQASIERLSNNHIVVTFPSLSRDSVAKEESTNPLGGQLPDLTWMPSGAGSKYTFEYESEKGFLLKTEDRGEDGRFIVGVIDY